jgi:hypothetical protein
MVQYFYFLKNTCSVRTKYFSENLNFDFLKHIFVLVDSLFTEYLKKYLGNERKN